MAEGRDGGDFKIEVESHPFEKGKGGMLGTMTALEAVFHPGLYGSGIALGDPEVLEHSRVQNVVDTSQVVRAQIYMVEGIEEIFSEFDLAFMKRRLQPCHPKSAFYSPQGFLGAGIFAGQG